MIVARFMNGGGGGRLIWRLAAKGTILEACEVAKPV